MIWKSVSGYEGLYEVSKRGRCRRIDFAQIRILAISNSKGYQYVHLCKDGNAKRIRLSRLILEAFVGAPPNPKYQANHKNGNKLDDSIANLEWITCAGNINHSIKVLGYDPRLSGRRYSEEQILEMRRLYAAGMKAWHIGVKMGIRNPNIVYKIVHRKSWTHI